MGIIKKWNIFLLSVIVISGCAASGQEASEVRESAENTRRNPTETIQEESEQNPEEMGNTSEETGRDSVGKDSSEIEEIWEKGYKLPLEPDVQAEAEEDCIQAMGKIRAVYIEAEKGDALNPVLQDETILKMYDILQETGCPVAASGFYYTMGNDKKMEAFLEDCLSGKESRIVLYKLCTGGGINRSQFLFDGNDMYVVDTVSMWNEKNSPYISNSSYTRIKDWEYTEKGWFSYEYCMPEFPDVTEIANGNSLLRVKPVKEEYIRMAESYLLPIGYMGNNLLRSDWNEEHLEDLDYTGLYESLYRMKYQNTFDAKKYEDGIPKEEFEDLIMEFLPVTREELARYAAFDEEKQNYRWKRLGPLTYMANSFSTSIPEVTDITENPDGTLLVSVDVVCPARGEDSLMSHVLTLRIMEDGSVRYLGNQILGDGLEKITEYQYRLSK